MQFDNPKIVSILVVIIFVLSVIHLIFSGYNCKTFRDDPSNRPTDEALLKVNYASLTFNIISLLSSGALLYLSFNNNKSSSNSNKRYYSISATKNPLEQQQQQQQQQHHQQQQQHHNYQNQNPNTNTNTYYQFDGNPAVILPQDGGRGVRNNLPELN